jgi:ABC-type nitrate/sulfonate/bicarbonate transport system substrate-binding protein
MGAAAAIARHALRTRRLPRCALASILLLSACGGAVPQPPRHRPVRLAVSVADFADVPRLVAERDLARAGRPVVSTEFARPELTIQALMHGEADVAIGSMALAWAATSRGAPLVTVMELARSRHVVAAVPSVRTCRDLDGRRVVVNSLGSTGAELFAAYHREACPEARPHVMVMQGNQNRSAALLTGTIDAAVILRDDAMALERRAPGRTVVVEDFGTRWPLVMSIGVVARRSFASEDPAAVRDYLRACLSSVRTLTADASHLAAAAKDVLGGDQDYSRVAEAYLKTRAWDPDGGLTSDAVRETRRFLVRSETLGKDADESVLVDRSFLDAVLAEIGRTAK